MLLAGSNKQISIFDINASKEISLHPDGHKKQPHTLKFYRSTDYLQNPDTEQYNIFLTAAADNSIILHDIRAPGEELTLSGHVNTALELGADISPCQRYVISGSEDRSAYVWDVRTGKVLDRLRGFREAASDVTFNPAYPQVAIASINGQIRFFRSNR
jgi:WD40 repeat protein